jgi:hypothetical protein
MTIVTLMRLQKPDKVDYAEQDLDEEFMDSLDDLEHDYTDELRWLLRQMLCTNPDNRKLYCRNRYHEGAGVSLRYVRVVLGIVCFDEPPSGTTSRSKLPATLGPPSHANYTSTLGPTPKDILGFFYANEDTWKEMSTAPSCTDIDLHLKWLHWSPKNKLQINDFFADMPSSPKKPKKPKAKIGGLVVPDSDDEDDDEDPKTVKDLGK